MISVRLKDLLAVREPLVKLSAYKLNFKLSYLFTMLYKTSIEEFEKYEQCRLDLLSKYTSYGEDGSSILDEEGKKLFSEEISKILDSEVSIELEKIDISKIPDNVLISISDTYILEKFLSLN